MARRRTRTGPVPAPGSDAEAVDERRTRSFEEPLDVRLRSRQPYPLLEVRNPLHGTVYLVMLPEFPARTSALCTCTDFARRGLGTCKHIEAGLRWAVGHPDAPPLREPRQEPARVTGAWRRIDQRTAAARRDKSQESRAWRKAGAVLFDTDEG
jgi:hypothetical protein